MFGHSPKHLKPEILHAGNLTWVAGHCLQNFGDTLPRQPSCSETDSRLPWNFRNQVRRWIFKGNSLTGPKDLLIPFIGTELPGSG